MTEREPLENDSPSVSSPKTIDERDSGVIQGAFGTINLEDRTPSRTWRQRLLTLAAIIGPGIIVLVGDNDAGGVATYAQVGQNFGYSLLWTLLLLVPVLIVNQEMVVRLGAVTGVGLAKLIVERFGRFWGWYSVAGLFLLNFLVISTEFIGVGLAAEYFGFNRYIVVPIATLVLIGITASGNFRQWERAMFVFLFASLLVLPLAALSHPSPGAVLRGFLVPGIDGGITASGTLMIFAIVGTTVAPWQLFFQQSNVVDKRITPRWLDYEKAASVVLIPSAPLGLITTAVQVLAGILLPSATVFALLLCNDPEVLGPWINRPWLNVIAIFIVGVLLALSTILVLTTVFPSIDVGRVALVLGVLVGAGTVAAAAWGVRMQARLASVPRMSREERASWRMPALALLQRPPWSVVRRVAMVALSGYLVLTILMLIVRAIQIALKPFS